MEIELSRLEAVETPVCGELSLGEAAGEGAPAGPGRSLSADGIRFPEPLQVDLKAHRTEDGFAVGGRITGAVSLQCARCLEDFRRALDLDFRARFAPEPVMDAADADDEGLEIAREQLDVSFLPRGTTALSVEEIVREQVLLDLPFRFICRNDCAGLCPRCGADRNRDRCGCEEKIAEELADPRLRPLLALKKRVTED